MEPVGEIYLRANGELFYVMTPRAAPAEAVAATPSASASTDNSDEEDEPARKRPRLSREAQCGRDVRKLEAHVRKHFMPIRDSVRTLLTAFETNPLVRPTGRTRGCHVYISDAKLLPYELASIGPLRATNGKRAENMSAPNWVTTDAHPGYVGLHYSLYAYRARVRELLNA
jgi:hypothetical protein